MRLLLASIYLIIAFLAGCRHVDHSEFKTMEELRTTVRYGSLSWLVEPRWLPTEVSLQRVTWDNDGFTLPKVTAYYGHGRRTLFTFTIWGGIKDRNWVPHKTIPAGSVPFEVMVFRRPNQSWTKYFGRTGTYILQWRESDQVPWKYINATDSNLDLDTLIKIAASTQ